jgi:hypothetical protein
MKQSFRNLEVVSNKTKRQFTLTTNTGTFRTEKMSKNDFEEYLSATEGIWRAYLAFSNDYERISDKTVPYEMEIICETDFWGREIVYNDEHKVEAITRDDKLDFICGL